MTEKYQPVAVPPLEKAGTLDENGETLTFQECYRRQGREVIKLLALVTEDDFRRYVEDYPVRMATAADSDEKTYSAIQNEYQAVYEGIPIDIWRTIFSPRYNGPASESH